MSIEKKTEEYHQISNPNDDEPPKDDKSNDQEPPKDQSNEYEALKDNKSASSYENKEPSNDNANNETENEIPKAEESKSKSEPEQPETYTDTKTTNDQNVNSNETELTEKTGKNNTTENINTDVTINMSNTNNDENKNNEENSFKHEKRPTILRDGEMKFIMNVLKCCDDMQDIDAYQVMAFDHNTKATWKDQFRYVFDIIKCVLCALTQVFGILIIMAEVVKIGLTEKDWCNIPEVKNNDWSVLFEKSNLKTLAFLFSSFLAYFSIDRLTTVNKGMYYKMKYTDKIKWVDSTWLRIGLFVNLFVSIIAVYGSFLVIFFSDNSLDMVLNSVALFFIIELDDLLTKRTDYERIQEHIENYNDDNEAMLKEDLNKEEVGQCKYCFRACCGTFGTFLNWFVTVPFVIIQYVTIAFCLFCPGLVVVCY